MRSLILHKNWMTFQLSQSRHSSPHYITSFFKHYNIVAIFSIRFSFSVNTIVYYYMTPCFCVSNTNVRTISQKLLLWYYPMALTKRLFLVLYSYQKKKKERKEIVLSINKVFLSVGLTCDRVHYTFLSTFSIIISCSLKPKNFFSF